MKARPSFPSISSLSRPRPTLRRPCSASPRYSPISRPSPCSRISWPFNSLPCRRRIPSRTPADAAPSEPLVKTPPPPAIPKLKPQPAKPDTKKTFNVDNVLALLNHVAPAASSAPNTRIADRNVKGFGAQNAMTADLEDALRSQIKPCWSPPVGAPHPEQLVVNFDLFLNPDGSVAQPPQLAADSASAAASNPYVQAAAEAARRAIYTCAPYKLPADKYADWREINPFTFDPRQMVGQ